MPSSERRRRPPWGRASAAAVVIAVVVVLGIIHAHSRTDPQPSRSSATTSPTVPVSPSSPSSLSPAPSSAPPKTTLPVGITFGDALFNLTRAHVDDALGDVVALHMTWIRVDFSWAGVQPRSASSYDWHPMDAIVASARERHLKVLGLLTYTPAWARASGCRSFACPPRSDAEFAHFASAVARRYRDDVTTYQIWNEPNIDLFWRGPDAGAYGKLLATTVAAMRGVDRQLRILFGGLAYTNSSDGDIAPTRFLVDACARRPCDVDAVGYDPFTYPSLPGGTSQPPNAWQLMSEAGTSGLRSALARAGLGGRMLWVTEFGAPTDYPGSTDPRAVSESAQARIVVDGLRLARAGSGDVGAYFVDTWRDARAGGTTRDHFGIERSDGTRKPAFAALASELAR